MKHELTQWKYLSCNVDKIVRYIIYISIGYQAVEFSLKGLLVAVNFTLRLFCQSNLFYIDITGVLLFSLKFSHFHLNVQKLGAQAPQKVNFECKSMNNYKAQTAQTLAITKILQNFGKQAHPRANFQKFWHSPSSFYELWNEFELKHFRRGFFCFVGHLICG